MSTMDPLTQLQHDVVHILGGEAYFSPHDGVPALAQVKGDTSQQIEERLGIKGYLANGAGKLGSVVYVPMPVCTLPFPDQTGKLTLDALVTAAAYETPDTNRGEQGIGHTAEETAQELLLTLQDRTVLDGSCTIRVDDEAIEPLPQDNKKVVAYMIFFTVRFSLALPLQVQPVRFAGGPGELVLACNTPGASVYYTTDGSYPSPSNPSAVLYGAALDVADCTVRAAAYFPPLYRGSNLTQITLN